MRIALIADAYLPLRTSGAVQMRDLARTLAGSGHEATMIVPAADQRDAWRLDRDGAVDVLRLRAPRTKDVGYLRRTLAELAMPFAMWRNLRRSPLAGRRFDGIVWYSPSIFFAPLVARLRRWNACPTYLILRDIFPEWAADMGLMRRGTAFRLLRGIARRQYREAGTIGVQTSANLPLVEPSAGPGTRVEILENWLAPPVDRGCPIDLSAGPLSGRKLLVYAGNMGVAQGMGRLIELADALRIRDDLGFVFVGRGSDATSLRQQATDRKLDNVLFFDEIDPDAVAGLYAQAHIGLVALDPRHRTHNIPGKFISYMHAGLPVLASINPGNDLCRLIEEEDVGRVSVSDDGGDLATLALALIDAVDASMRKRCALLAERRFSADTAAAQIARALYPTPPPGSRRAS